MVNARIQLQGGWHVRWNALKDGRSQRGLEVAHAGCFAPRPLWFVHPKCVAET